MNTKLLWFEVENVGRKKNKKIDIEKKKFWIFISRVKIPPGIQKSYLERRAMSANVLKTQILKLVVKENSPKTLHFGDLHHFEPPNTNISWSKTANLQLPQRQFAKTS